MMWVVPPTKWMLPRASVNCIQFKEEEKNPGVVEILANDFFYENKIEEFWLGSIDLFFIRNIVLKY